MINGDSAWWLQTWLLLSISKKGDVIPTPLTNSIIFQDGHIAPPTSIYDSLDQVLITNNHY